MPKSMLQLLTEVYENADTVVSGKGKLTTVNELTDQIPAVRPEVLEAAVQALWSIGPVARKISLILSEEDKGAILAGLFATQARIPLAMARHAVPYAIPGALQVPLSMEYMDSTLSVHGIFAGAKVLIIDDTLASGGTLVSLINAVGAVGATVVDVRVVVEKLGYGGRERVYEETGVEVRSVIGIDVKPHNVRVATIKDTPRERYAW